MKFHRSFTWRVFLIYAVVSLVLPAALVLPLVSSLRGQAEADLAENQRRQARLTADLASPHLADTPNGAQLFPLVNSLSQGLEGAVTILSPDGVVLAHSQGGQAGGLAPVPVDSPELSEARLGAVGQARRTLDGGNAAILSTAAPILVEGRLVGIVRLSTPASQEAGSLPLILTALGTWLTLQGALALLLVCIAARHSSRSLNPCNRWQRLPFNWPGATTTTV